MGKTSLLSRFTRPSRVGVGPVVARHPIWLPVAPDPMPPTQRVEHGIVHAARLLLGLYLLPVFIVLGLAACLVWLVCSSLDLFCRPQGAVLYSPGAPWSNRCRRHNAPAAQARPYLNN